MGNGDAFEAITAVNDGPMPREALPTDAIEPVAAAKSPWSDTPTTAMPAQSLKELIGASKPPADEHDAPAKVARDPSGAGELATIAPTRAYPVAPRSSWRVALGVALACVAISAAVIVWARSEVTQARAEARHARLNIAAQAKLAATAKSAKVAPAPQPPPAPASQPPPVPPAKTADSDEAADPELTDLTLAAQPLDDDMTALTVRSRPDGATVTYNGVVLGKTPLVVAVRRNERGTLRFRAPGMEPDARRIVPKEAAKSVSITLKPRR